MFGCGAPADIADITLRSRFAQYYVDVIHNNRVGDRILLHAAVENHKLPNVINGCGGYRAPFLGISRDQSAQTHDGVMN